MNQQTQQQVRWRKIHDDWAIVIQEELELGSKVIAVSNAGNESTVKIISRVGHFYYGHAYRIEIVEDEKPAIDVESIVDRIIDEGLDEYKPTTYKWKQKRTRGKVTTLDLANINNIPVSYRKLSSANAWIHYKRNSSGKCHSSRITLHNEIDNVFIHEMAHFYDLDEFGKKGSRKANDECVAEMSSFVICRMYGLREYNDIENVSRAFGYVAMWGKIKSDKDKQKISALISKNKERIYNVVKQAVQDMEKINKEMVI